MSINETLSKFLNGKHVMGCDSLATYHHIQAVKRAALKRDRFERFVAIKAALKNYRVMVNFTGDDKARIFDPETRTEVIL